MKRILLTLTCLLSGLLINMPARAFFGTDAAMQIPYLIKIITNTAIQLQRLRDIIQSGRDQINLVRDINRGINDSLNLIRTVYPDIDPGIFKEWSRITDATRELEKIYGAVPKSPEAVIQKNADQSAAEAITLNNSIYEYSKKIDEIGEQIKSASHTASPGGAQKLTAESMGVMLHVMNQSLRAQATGLKLQSETMAISNKKEKDETRHFLESAGKLSSALQGQDTSFGVPRF